MNKKQTAKILALAVGTLFVSATAFAAKGDATEAKIKCMGANDCKGQSQCQTATSSCSGENSCKGKGYILTNTEKECKDKGGKVEK